MLSSIISKIIILILIILILQELYKIYRLVFFRKIERYYNLSSNECKFDEKNEELKLESELDCINKCLSYEDNRKVYKDCTYKSCSDICGKCTKEKERGLDTTCPWDNKLYYQTEEYNNRNLVAPQININTYDGYIKVSFIKPNKFVDGYVYSLKNLSKKEGMIIGKFPNKDCITCETIIQDLDMESDYSIGVKSYLLDSESNEVSYSPMSNIVEFKPQIKLVASVYNIPVPIEELSTNYKFCDN